MFAHVKRSPKTGSQAHFKSLVNSSWSYPGNIVALCVLTSTLGGLRCSGCVPTARCEPLGEAEGSGARSLDPCLAPKPSSAAQLCGSAGVTLGELPAFPAQASGRLFLQRAGLGLPPRAIVPGTHPGPPAETGLTLSFCTGPYKPSSGLELDGDDARLRVFSVVPTPVCSIGVKAVEMRGREPARPGPSTFSGPAHLRAAVCQPRASASVSSRGRMGRIPSSPRGCSEARSPRQMNHRTVSIMRCELLLPFKIY